ncbi:RNA polymerase sigma-70 factor [Jatrophihabitans sp. GAS493]|uniref:sigma-70 family RNA polymerase sigma factor n=1 Tax=Jatrophihabitans sp. GAS493 TaxID=1907575 RepID=UPI000BB83F55|nr:sigma-70 family RNA polymerase sigma factor [Jatrophihabitans sp. GAS493]SOD74992.1 RNA polymerase sigma-70 factor [Jatrophihabitans sp. GAS493]
MTTDEACETPFNIEGRIRDLFDQHRQPLLDYTTRLTRGDAAWAEDVVQDTFIRAWRHLDRLTPELGSVRGWLMRVAHNRVMDGYRAARTRPVTIDFDESHGSPVEDSSEDVLRKSVVTNMLDQLPALHREAIVATILSDRTMAQAADLLGVPEGTIKSRVFYALRMLRSAPGSDETQLIA